ncbi:hypothetical protein F4813DRAFT_359471 [Daldinia decipiens]|uniref:uncharacterized protein n=1 Tax=Daldinia decipiens TaxID=326647 RepID=UPI0020C1E6C1|nr:uncharacterized protein F4813DRAFT_359471 [Daldinia decipiens]KAI1657757.1 hypothetical protein F4813DRAFT_359471 [Daldinia decipiens]
MAQSYFHPPPDPTDPTLNLRAWQDATFHGVDYSNNACTAMKEGRFEESVELHKKALESKLRFHPADSIQAAISYNGMGEGLLRAGRLEEADEAFQKALRVREGGGPVLDAAVTRDNIGQLREAQGRFAEAREIRIRGSGEQMVCGFYYCPHSRTFTQKDLKACGACQSVFYCSKECQKQDWTKRHKPLCQARQAEGQSSNQGAGQ